MGKRLHRQRAGGILLHPTSLTGPEGIGTLGPEAYAFVDFLSAAGLTLWQMLPLGRAGFGESPYQCYSAFAGSPLLISLERLVEEGWLPATAFEKQVLAGTSQVPFRAVHTRKPGALKLAHVGFCESATTRSRNAFARFTAAEADWLNDYALFEALKTHFAERPWWLWPVDIRHRRPAALKRFRQRLAEEINYVKFVQFLFFDQWRSLRRYATRKGVHIIGDIPLYVATDSADVWAKRRNFCLEQRGRPRLMAGVPPDSFSVDGQLWGNPVYNWPYLKRTGFAWWIERVRASLDLFDYVRIDHFRGLISYWAVPGKSNTARNGRWIEAPGKALMQVLHQELGPMNLIVEDLGQIIPEVYEVRDAHDMPGMKILQYAFDGDPASQYLPHNYDENFVVYTGTHDNDTMMGWYNHAPARVKRNAEAYLGCSLNGSVWPFVRLAWSSPARLAVVPMQDLLDLDNRARMNTPGTVGGRNWRWRLRGGELTPSLARRLKRLTKTYGRQALG
ncbi:MAG: 4-alpha-glucanotransferase [Verrucomicrobia bacterium]|nr:4-alpha-glucanotransferase [Verrucomicrobiota bacterium]